MNTIIKNCYKMEAESTLFSQPVTQIVDEVPVRYRRISYNSSTTSYLLHTENLTENIQKEYLMVLQATPFLFLLKARFYECASSFQTCISLQKKVVSFGIFSLMFSSYQIFKPIYTLKLTFILQKKYYYFVSKFFSYLELFVQKL